MSSDTAPPSIPPRKRPTPQGGRPSTVTGSDPATFRPPVRPAGTGGPTAADAPPVAAPPRASVSSEARTAAPASAPPPADDEPSPLQAAVGSVTSTFRRAAAATSAAISSATQPRTEEPTMTAAPSSTAPRTDAGSAGSAADAALGARDGQARPPATGGLGAPRRVRLAVSRVDPWSVMNLSFLLSVAVGIMLVIGSAVLWFALDGMHVFAQVDTMVREVLGAESDVDILQYVKLSRIVSAATIVAVVDVFLLTALSTIGAFLYNITAALVGGVHVTLTDD